MKREGAHRTQVSVPWYVWAILSLIFLVMVVGTASVLITGN